jgi:hypothetical protein
MTTLTKLNEDEVLNSLRTNLEGVRVLFTKKDGTEREMLCTLVSANIPTESQPKESTQSSSVVGSAVRVFDLDKKEWRSFRWDSVKSVNGVLYD